MTRVILIWGRNYRSMANSFGFSAERNARAKNVRSSPLDRTRRVPDESHLQLPGERGVAGGFEHTRSPRSRRHPLRVEASARPVSAPTGVPSAPRIGEEKETLRQGLSGQEALRAGGPPGRRPSAQEALQSLNAKTRDEENADDQK